MSRSPLDVDFDVRSGVQGILEVLGDLEGKVLSWCGMGLGASSNGCLVVGKDPYGVCAAVVFCPLSGI